MESLNKIVFIGAGNVATHMAIYLKSIGKSITQIYSYKHSYAMELAEKINVSYTCDISEINKNADIYIISVLDTYLPVIASSLKTDNKLVVHTSGFHHLEIIKNTSENTGVIYPLQTFTKNCSVNFHNIPICIEANTEENLQILKTFASHISNDIRHIDSEKRKWLHLAAVFACNFSNYIYSISEKILQEHNIPFDILKPLIIETAAKIIKHNPSKVQTGPAIRGDIQVIEQHFKMLEQKNYKYLYKLISDNILKIKTDKANETL